MATLVNDRIDVRISKENKALIKYASELSGFKSLSEFIVFITKNEANRIIKENDSFLKTLEDKKLFIDTLLNPPAPNDALKKAHSNYLKMLNDDELSDSTP